MRKGVGVAVGKVREAAHHVGEAVFAARAEQPSPAVQTPQLAAEQLQLAALSIRMRGLEPAVGDGDLPGECTSLRAGRRYCAESSEHRVTTRGATTVSTAEHGPIQRSTRPLEP